MKIAAIVVTYNRKKHLINCINAIQNQSKKVDKIFIIDNASTDGTEETIKRNFGNCDNLEYFRLNINSGGAGGFNYGIDKAYKDGFDIFWLMDDDGIPKNDCLEQLLLVKDKTDGDYICSTVLNIDNPKELSFGLYDKNKRRTIKFYKDLQYLLSKGYLEGSANPFNGLLLSRRLVEKVGLPKAELFIWGDEIEYELRVKKAGFTVYTALKAIHFHPASRLETKKIFMGKINVLDIGKSELRRYCYFRNRAYIYKKYYRFSKLPFFIIKYLWFFTLQKDFNSIKFFIKSVKDGLNEKFDGHYKYIK